MKTKTIVTGNATRVHLEPVIGRSERVKLVVEPHSWFAAASDLRELAKAFKKAADKLDGIKKAPKPTSLEDEVPIMGWGNAQVSTDTQGLVEVTVDGNTFEMTRDETLALIAALKKHARIAG